MGWLAAPPSAGGSRSKRAPPNRRAEIVSLEVLEAILRGGFLSWRQHGQLSRVSAVWRRALEDDPQLHATAWHGACLAIAREDCFLRVPRRAFAGGWQVCFWSELHPGSERAQLAAKDALKHALGAPCAVETSAGPLSRAAIREAAAARRALRRRMTSTEAATVDQLLFTATQSTKQQLVHALLMSGADPNMHVGVGDEGGTRGVEEEEGTAPNLDTPLFHACVNNNAPIAEQLICAGASPHAVSNTWAGVTPLYAAANHGNAHIVRRLLEAGADVNQVAKDGFSPLLIATQEGREVVVALLLDAGASVNHAMSDGFSALLLACQEGHCGVVRQLLASGADTAQAVPDGATSLLIAAQHGHLDVCSLLLDHPDCVAVDQPMSDGATPLMVSSQNGHLDVVELLLRRGANPQAMTSTGATPIVHAARMGHDLVVAALAAAGADVNAGKATDNDFSAMLWSCQEGYTRVANVLITWGVDVNQPAANGATPLVYALHFGHVRLGTLLLEHGANAAVAKTWLRNLSGQISAHSHSWS